MITYTHPVVSNLPIKPLVAIAKILLYMLCTYTHHNIVVHMHSIICTPTVKKAFVLSI